MSREAWLGLYEKLTGLVEKLPGGLQKPILRELVPIRELFLETRPARILLVGPAGSNLTELLAGATAGQPLQMGDNDNGWRTYEVPGRGQMLVLDARDDVPHSTVEVGLARFEPDVIFVAFEDGGSRDLATAAARVVSIDRQVPVAGAWFGSDTTRAELRAGLASERGFSQRRSGILDGRDAEEFAEGLCRLLPNPAKLEFARLTGAKRAQAQIAGSLLKSFTAVCGVIAVQPIPLADLPVLTTLQTLMVALIIHSTGRRASLRLVAEFLGALGFNIGAGLLFREGARALLKIVPFWGHAVSGIVAGAGTYAIGRAAIAYFIEETPINETRKLFRKLLPQRNPPHTPPPLPPA